MLVFVFYGFQILFYTVLKKEISAEIDYPAPRIENSHLTCREEGRRKEVFVRDAEIPLLIRESRDIYIK